VPELAGESAIPLPETAVEDDSRTDSCPESEQDQAMNPLTRPVCVFAEGREIGVVPEGEGDIDELLEGREERETVEGGIVGGMEDFLVFEAVKSGETEAAGFDLTRGCFFQIRPNSPQTEEKLVHRGRSGDASLVEDTTAAIDQTEFDPGASEVEASETRALHS
jgi:hypothetical protein